MATLDSGEALVRTLTAVTWPVILVFLGSTILPCASKSTLVLASILSPARFFRASSDLENWAEIIAPAATGDGSAFEDAGAAPGAVGEGDAGAACAAAMVAQRMAGKMTCMGDPPGCLHFTT